MNIISDIFSFLCAVFLLITIHELGHFCMAKAFNVKVLCFSIGFGKPVWIHKGKETQTILAAIPLGGYVKMLDSRESTVFDARAFDLQPPLSRLAIICAGPLANLLFAFMANWALFTIGLEAPKPIISQVITNSIAAKAGMQANTQILSIDEASTPNWPAAMIPLISAMGEEKPLKVKSLSLSSKQITTQNLDLQHLRLRKLNVDPLTSLGIKPYQIFIPPIIFATLPESPASKANFKKGDRILKINEQEIKDWSDLNAYISSHPQQLLSLHILRNNLAKTIKVYSEQKFSHWKIRGYIGIKPFPIPLPKTALEKQQYPFLSAWLPALKETINLTKFNFIIVWKMISGKISLLQLGGPISIFETANRAFKEGFIHYLNFLVMLSISLGCLNILPIPGLDGGHLLFLSINSMRKSPISLPLESLITRLGIIFLLVLMCHATINDLSRLFS